MVVYRLDCGGIQVRVWLYTGWNVVVHTLDFGCIQVGLWLYTRWILVENTLDFGCIHDVVLTSGNDV